jgi:hypothetical protein
MFFAPLGLALSEKQISQIAENTEKSQWLMELLEADSARCLWEVLPFQFYF